jgi:hypothetical protein
MRPETGERFGQREARYRQGRPIVLIQEKKMYKKPAITKHEELTQITFSSH